jgi:hypothetical protein
MQRGIEAYFSRGDNKNEIPDKMSHLPFQKGYIIFPMGLG